MPFRIARFVIVTAVMALGTICVTACSDDVDCRVAMTWNEQMSECVDE